MIYFTVNPTKVGRSTSDGISLGKGKVKIWLALKDEAKVLILILTNVFYLSNNPSNFVNLGLLNVRIYYHNEEKTFYNFKTQKILTFAKQYKLSFLSYSLNLSAAAINLLKNSKFYEDETLIVNQTTDKKLSLIRWHQCLGHLNPTSLKRHLIYYNIASIDDTKYYMCDSYKKAKATKRYN